MQRIVFFFLVWVVGMNMAYASDAALLEELNGTVKYDAKWKGMTVGKLSFDVAPLGKDRFRVVSSIKSKGIVAAATKYKSSTAATLKFKDGVFYTTEYESDMKRRNKPRNIAITYKGTDVQAVTITPPEKSWKRKDVPNTLRNKALSPLGMVLTAWYHSANAIAAGKHSADLTFDVYDGRRQSKATFALRPINTTTLKATVSYTPVAGYSDRDLERHKEAAFSVTAIIDKEKRLPISIQGLSNIGDGKAVLKDVVRR